MFVRIADVYCGNGGTKVRKATLAMCANLPVVGCGAENAPSSHKYDLDILCSERDQFYATHSNCNHKDNWRKNRTHKSARLRLQDTAWRLA